MFNPSLMCMDLTEIKAQTKILNERCDFFHVDIMDGHFVKNLTLSPGFVEAFAPLAKKPIDCHLMVTNPADYVEPLAKAGANYICPHLEAINADAFRILEKIRQAGCKTGLVLNPSTPLSAAKHLLGRIDMLTIMTVDPGFAGSPFLPEMLDKIREAKQIKEENNLHYLIEIDGSCSEKTFGQLHEAGAEVFIVGSSGLFGLDPNLKAAWNKMIEIFKSTTGKEEVQ